MKTKKIVTRGTATVEKYLKFLEAFIKFTSGHGRFMADMQYFCQKKHVSVMVPAILRDMYFLKQRNNKKYVFVQDDSTKEAIVDAVLHRMRQLNKATPKTSDTSGPALPFAESNHTCSVDDHINALKALGYKVMRPTTNFEEV